MTKGRKRKRRVYADNKPVPVRDIHSIKKIKIKIRIAKSQTPFDSTNRSNSFISSRGMG